MKCYSLRKKRIQFYSYVIFPLLLFSCSTVTARAIRTFARFGSNVPRLTTRDSNGSTALRYSAATRDLNRSSSILAARLTVLLLDQFSRNVKAIYRHRPYAVSASKYNNFHAMLRSSLCDCTTSAYGRYLKLSHKVRFRYGSFLKLFDIVDLLKLFDTTNILKLFDTDDILKLFDVVAI